MKRYSSGLRVSSAEQPVVAHIDCRNCSGTQEECHKEMFMAAVDAAQIGYSAICISLEPTKESVGEFSDEQDPWEWNEKTAERAPEPRMTHGRGNVRTFVSIFPAAQPVLPPTQAALASSPSQYADNHHLLHHHSAAQPVLPPTQAATRKRKRTVHEEVAAELHEARGAGEAWVRLTEAQHALVRYDYTPVIKHARGHIITVKREACITDERTYYWLPHYEALGKWPSHYLVTDELCRKFARSHPTVEVVGGASYGFRIPARNGPPGGGVATRCNPANEYSEFADDDIDDDDDDDSCFSSQCCTA